MVVTGMKTQSAKANTSSGSTRGVGATGGAVGTGPLRGGPGEGNGENAPGVAEPPVAAEAPVGIPEGDPPNWDGIAGATAPAPIVGEAGAGRGPPPPAGEGGGGGGAGGGGPNQPVAGGGGGGGAGGGGGGGGGGGPPGGGGGVPPGGPPPPQAVAPLSNVGRMLSVCGANAQEIYALENTERIMVQALAQMKEVAVTQLALRLEKRQPPISLPVNLITNVQALCFWAGKLRRQGGALNANEFTTAVLEQALDEMEILVDSSMAPDIKPLQLREENWEDWYQEFLTYLSHVTGKQRAPLDYVVRVEPPPGGPGMLTPREMELYSYPLSRP